MEKQEVFEGEGTIEKKEDGITKKGDPYFKFIIDGKTYSLFEHEAGKGVKIGDHVGMYWTETPSSFNGKPITYRNLNSIFEKETTVETVSENQPKKDFSGVAQSVTQPPRDTQKVNDYKTKEADIYELGMAKNNATLIFCKLLDKEDSVEDVETFIKDNGDTWNKLTMALYTRGKKIREELLGY